MIDYEFHPAARSDLDEIWDYIRADNIDAADASSRMFLMRHRLGRV